MNNMKWRYPWLESFVFQACIWPLLCIIRRKEILRTQSHLNQASLVHQPSLYQVYQAMWHNGIDSLFYLLHKNKNPIVFHGFHDLKTHLSKGSPAVVVSIHIGAFEMSHRALSTLGFPTYTLAAPFSNPWIQKALQRIRQAPHLEFVHPAESAKLLRRLKKPCIIATMADQSRWSKPAYFPFLGRENGFWLELTMRANGLGAKLYTLRVQRIGNEHHLILESMENPSPEKIVSRFSSWIQETPEQWVWNYPRLWDGAK